MSLCELYKLLYLLVISKWILCYVQTPIYSERQRTHCNEFNKMSGLKNER